MTSDSQALTTTEHSPVAGFAHDSRGISNVVLGMLLFITSEVMFFAGLFAAYFASRAAVAPWPPTEFEHTLEAFGPVFPATIMLVISSVTCQIGVNAIRRDDRAGFIRAIGITLVLGIMFLLIQVFDYGLLYSEGLTVAAGPYGTTYYTLTGFHGAHVFGGVIMLGVVLYRGMAGQFSSRHHDAVEATSIYWHFVDVVWIGLYTTLYWLR